MPSFFLASFFSELFASESDNSRFCNITHQQPPVLSFSICIHYWATKIACIQ